MAKNIKFYLRGQLSFSLDVFKGINEGVMEMALEVRRAFDLMRRDQYMGSIGPLDAHRDKLRLGLDMHTVDNHPAQA